MDKKISKNQSITVIEASGPVGCGKSTVLNVIAGALERQGYPVALSEKEAARLAQFGRVVLLVEREG